MFLISSLSAAWTWAGGCSCLTVGTLPPPFLDFFSAADANHQIRAVTNVRDLGIPLDTNLTSTVHCREAADTARRLLFVVLRSVSGLSMSAFIPLCCAILRPYLEYAIEANSPNLRAYVHHLERVQRLATRLVPYEERLRKFN